MRIFIFAAVILVFMAAGFWLTAELVILSA